MVITGRTTRSRQTAVESPGQFRSGPTVEQRAFAEIERTESRMMSRLAIHVSNRAHSTGAGGPAPSVAQKPGY
jgi:hypothetical protein